MIARSAQIVLELDRDRLSAVCAEIGRESVSVRAWCSARRPPDLDPADATAVGEWIRGELEKAGMPKARLVLAVERGEVVLKRLTLPHAPGMVEGDLAEMVRLQMARLMPLSMEGTAVDFVPLDGGETARASESRVLAGALPGERLSWLRAVCDRIGLPVKRIGLRAAGAAAAAAATASKFDGPVLCVAPGWASTEFVIIERGLLLFARSADIALPPADAEGAPDGDAVERFAVRAAVEAKRTWMAYRSSPDSVEVEAVAVLSERGRIADEIGRRCGEELEMPWEPLAPTEAVRFPEEMGEAERCVARPLAGLVGERLLAGRTLDFASPRRAPDRAAARRQKALLGVAALIGLVGSAVVAAWLDLGRLQADLSRERQRVVARDREYTQMLLEDARLNHIKAWTEPRIDWLDHLRLLTEQFPDTRRAQLAGFVGTMDAGVAFRLAQGDSRYSSGSWESGQRGRISLQGRVTARQVAAELRERLLETGLYTVEPHGADVADRFDLQLLTSVPSPFADEGPAVSEGAEQDGGDEGGSPESGGGGS